MNLIRLAACIAVTMIAFACDKNNESRKILLADIPVDKKEVRLSNSKVEEESDNEKEGFFSDTVSKPQSSRTNSTATQQQQTPVTKPDWDKKIIKTAVLNLEVKDYAKFYASLREKINGVGGYIAQEEQTQSAYKIENALTIKVPVDQFDNAIAALTTNIEKINEKKIASQDVTTKFIDTKSRMEAKKQVRLRYIDLLKQAKNMEEILSVQSEINDIQEEIESAAGQIEYLGHSSTFSTINLTYYQIINSSAKNTDNPSFLTQLTSAFNTGWSWIGDLFVGLVSIWPLFFLLFIAIVIYKRTKSQKLKKA